MLIYGSEYDIIIVPAPALAVGVKSLVLLLWTACTRGFSYEMLKRLDVVCFVYSLYSVISKSSLPQIRLHDLRHSVASNLIANGMSIVDVQEWLGHANASTTLDVYSHAAKSSKDSIAAALQQMITL